MASLGLMLLSLLHFKAVGADIHLYHTAGPGVVLPCSSVAPANTECSNVSWLFNRHRFPTVEEVEDGAVREQSGRRSRLSLDSNCSLAVANFTAEDAGFYTCRQGRFNTSRDAMVYLNILTVSQRRSNADPWGHSEVMLACSLVRYSGLAPCEQNSFRWLDDTGAELSNRSIRYELTGQVHCSSYLTVRRQTGPSTRFTCQFLREDKATVEADFTPVFTDWSPLSSIMLTLRVSGLILMVGVTVLIITDKAIKQSLRHKPIRYHGDVTADSEDV